MADIKISQLTASTSCVDADLLAISQDNDGSYSSKSVSFANLQKSITALGNKTGGNYTEVESDGTLKFNGDATVWDDLRVSLTATNASGSKAPGFSLFKDNGAGSQGVFAYHFDASAEEELYFEVQMPHGWKLESTIYPHIHWCPINANAGNVCWALEYTWASINSAFGNTTIIYTSDPSDQVAYGHQIVNIGSGIDGTGKGLSSILVCRLFRDATSSLGTDDYASDAVGISFDIHYEIDTVGSRQVTTK